MAMGKGMAMMKELEGLYRPGQVQLATMTFRRRATWDRKVRWRWREVGPRTLCDATRGSNCSMETLSSQARRRSGTCCCRSTWKS